MTLRSSLRSRVSTLRGLAPLRQDFVNCFFQKDFGSYLINPHFQVGVFGLSRRFARVVNQVLKIGVRYLRRNLGIVIEPLKKILNGLLTKFAPDDLTALLL